MRGRCRIGRRLLISSISSRGDRLRMLVRRMGIHRMGIHRMAIRLEDQCHRICGLRWTEDTPMRQCGQIQALDNTAVVAPRPCDRACKARLLDQGRCNNNAQLLAIRIRIRDTAIRTRYQSTPLPYVLA